MLSGEIALKNNHYYHYYLTDQRLLRFLNLLKILLNALILVNIQ